MKALNVCFSKPNGDANCGGDFGGPLALKSSKIQVSLTSFGSEAGCELDYLAAFTHITSYLDWIKKNTGVEY